MSHDFLLRSNPLTFQGKVYWQVMLLPESDIENSKTVAFFVGPTPELAPLVAGDYVEFLNEKYLDKNINEEWPNNIDLWAHLEYHLKAAGDISQRLNENLKGKKSIPDDLRSNLWGRHF